MRYRKKELLEKIAVGYRERKLQEDAIRNRDKKLQERSEGEIEEEEVDMAHLLLL